jgi:hypothetical protein
VQRKARRSKKATLLQCRLQKHGTKESLALFGCCENDLKGPKNLFKLQKQQKLEPERRASAAGKQQLNLGVPVSNLKTNFSLYSKKNSESTVDFSTFQSYRHLWV